MATSKIKQDLQKTVKITAQSTTQDEFFISVGNAVASVSTGDTVPISAAWTDHDIYFGVGLYLWGSACFLLASPSYIYNIIVRVSAQTISVKKRVETTAF